MKKNLRILLKNAYNSKWPKEFDATAFVYPNDDLTPIPNASALDDFCEEDLESLAKMLLELNNHLVGTTWYTVYLSVLY